MSEQERNLQDPTDDTDGFALRSVPQPSLSLNFGAIKEGYILPRTPGRLGLEEDDIPTEEVPKNR